MIKIAGVDISLNNIGVCKAIVGEDMSISVEKLILIQPTKADLQTKKQVRKNSDDLRRLRYLHNELHKALDGSDMIAVEMPVGSQSARSMVSYAGCLGVLSSVAKPFIELTPSEVKLAGAGTKTATKQEMIEWAYSQYPSATWKFMKRAGKMVLTNDNEHMADAVGCVHAAILTDQFRSAMAMARSFSGKL